MKTAVYVLVALAAAAGGFAIYRFGIAPSEMPPAAQTMAVTPATERAMPATLPEFSLLDREGELRAISSWPGRSMIVNFWATWCAPCRREIPLLNELQRTHGEAGFQVVGVAMDIREDVLAYADEIGIDYPILIGEQEALDAINLFGLESVGFPFTVFTDDQARIV
ncbi:MAG: TlpA family protein disulfide reductase, partial [Proteobacteria bacterium]